MKNTIYLIISLIISLITLLIFHYINSNYISINSITYINIMNTNYMPIRDEAPPLYFISDYIEKIEKLKTIFKEIPITSRLKYKGILISRLGEEEIIINGIDAQNDKKIFDIMEEEAIKNISDTNKNYIIISSSISSALELGVGDDVILKLITIDGYYNAEEYTIAQISDDLDYNYALINIDSLNNFVNLENAASEIYIKDKNIKESYGNIVKNIFGNDFNIYTISDIKPDINENNKSVVRFVIYAILAYLFISFAVYIFLNSYNFNRDKNKIMFSVIGFIIAFIIYKIINPDTKFNAVYIIIPLINILCIIIADTIFKINKFHNILTDLSFVVIYVLYFAILYSSFIYMSINKNDDILKIVKIRKLNTSDNTFLFNGSITNADLIIEEINSYDSEARIEKILSFPVAVVTRTGSLQSKVYNNSITDMSNFITEGSVYEDSANQIIVGKGLADYLKIKTGDRVSLMAKGSRGWLETDYFTIKGIYELQNKNYDIYAGVDTVSNFIYAKEGDKSPYNENLLILSKEPIYSKLKENDSIKDMEIINSSNDINNNIILALVIISAFASSLISASIFSISYRNDKCGLIKKYASLSILSIILSLIIAFIFYSIVIQFVLFTVLVMALSFLLSIISANYKKY